MPPHEKAQTKDCSQGSKCDQSSRFYEERHHQGDLHEPVYEDAAHAGLHVRLDNAHIVGYGPSPPLQESVQSLSNASQAYLEPTGSAVKPTSMLQQSEDVTDCLMLWGRLPCSCVLCAISKESGRAGAREDEK